jgi:RNA polymerase sigma factor (sigma-70 family)
MHSFELGSIGMACTGLGGQCARHHVHRTRYDEVRLRCLRYARRPSLNGARAVWERRSEAGVITRLSVWYRARYAVPGRRHTTISAVTSRARSWRSLPLSYGRGRPVTNDHKCSSHGPTMERAELERELERLHPACWGWALTCCGRDRDIAEEALQSAYLKIVSGQARFEGRSSLRSWVFAVIRLTTNEEVRRRRSRYARESGGERELDYVTNPAPGADLVVERADEQAAITSTLVAALSTLSPRQREVLELVFYHGMTIEEAAEIMRVSLGSARTHYNRGKKALALALSPSLQPTQSLQRGNIT